MAEVNSCPVCENEDYFVVYVSSPNGYSSLISNKIGKVDLLVCTRCGCVYVSKYKLKQFEELRGQCDGW